MLPNELVRQLFTENGLVFIDDAQIPDHLKRQGWRSEIHQQSRDDGWVDILQIVTGPDANGETTRRREDFLAIQLNGAQLEAIDQVISVWIDEERYVNSDPCEELFDQLTPVY